MDSTACTFCGNPNATKIGDQYICDDCYIARGSCCAEWFEENDPPREKPVSGQSEKPQE